MKKNIFVFLLIITQPSIVWGISPKVECLDKAAAWFFENTEDGRDAAKMHAIDFCKKKGELECLNQAAEWFYNNTGDGRAAAKAHAVEFCVDSH